MLLDCPTKRVNLSPLEEQSSSKHTNTVMMQTAPPPPPQVAMAPEKLAHYDVPGKHLAFEQKPFTDRLQAMEESRLAALHYSTGLTRNIKLDDEHLGILGAAPTTVLSGLTGWRQATEEKCIHSNVHRRVRVHWKLPSA